MTRKIKTNVVNLSESREVKQRRKLQDAWRKKQKKITEEASPALNAASQLIHDSVMQDVTEQDCAEYAEQAKAITQCMTPERIIKSLSSENSNEAIMKKAEEYLTLAKRYDGARELDKAVYYYNAVLNIAVPHHLVIIDVQARVQLCSIGLEKDLLDDTKIHADALVELLNLLSAQVLFNKELKLLAYQAIVRSYTKLGMINLVEDYCQQASNCLSALKKTARQEGSERIAVCANIFQSAYALTQMIRKYAPNKTINGVGDMIKILGTLEEQCVSESARFSFSSLNNYLMDVRGLDRYYGYNIEFKTAHARLKANVASALIKKMRDDKATDPLLAIADSQEYVQDLAIKFYNEALDLSWVTKIQKDIFAAADGLLDIYNRKIEFLTETGQAISGELLDCHNKYLHIRHDAEAVLCKRAEREKALQLKKDKEAKKIFSDVENLPENVRVPAVSLPSVSALPQWKHEIDCVVNRIITKNTHYSGALAELTQSMARYQNDFYATTYLLLSQADINYRFLALSLKEIEKPIKGIFINIKETDIAYRKKLWKTLISCFEENGNKLDGIIQQFEKIQIQQEQVNENCRRLLENAVYSQELNILVEENSSLALEVVQSVNSINAMLENFREHMEERKDYLKSIGVYGASFDGVRLPTKESPVTRMIQIYCKHIVKLETVRKKATTFDRQLYVSAEGDAHCLKADEAFNANKLQEAYQRYQYALLFYKEIERFSSMARVCRALGVVCAALARNTNDVFQQQSLLAESWTHYARAKEFYCSVSNAMEDYSKIIADIEKEMEAIARGPNQSQHSEITHFSKGVSF